MDKPISVGDLVQVVRLCCVEHLCGHSPIFRVEDVHGMAIRKGYGKCSACHAFLPKELYGSPIVGKWGLPLSWLKRIPPLSELETTRTEDEVTA